MTKVTFTENGKTIEKEFKAEKEGKKFRDEYLKPKGIKGKWEW
jgi:hypothetical protein